MPDYRRPSLLTANQGEVSEWLLSKGVQCSTRKDDTALIITMDGTSAELTAALVGFVPTTAPDVRFRQALPGDLPAHVAHLATIRTATPVQLAAMTDAQVRHALQDVCKALALLIDDRLG